MKIRIDHIKDKPVTLSIREPVDRFPVLLQMQQDGECIFRGPVQAEISVEREFDHLRAAGRVTVPVGFSCSRCLVSYDSVIDSSFRIIFRKDSARQGEVEDETELSDDDLISSTYSGDEIDFSHDIEEQVAMGIPLKPLCDEGCRGLCPRCGADLNSGPCPCPQEPVSLNFSALKDFKVSR